MRYCTYDIKQKCVIIIMSEKYSLKYIKRSPLGKGKSFF